LRSLTIYFAIAGALVRPGDSIPPRLIKFSADFLIIKSPVFPTLLRPVKEVITFLKGVPGVFSSACFATRHRKCATQVARYASRKPHD
jgi:hypothetical protein